MNSNQAKVAVYMNHMLVAEKKKFALKSGCLNIAVKKVSSEIASRGNKISEKWPQNWHEIGPNKVTQLLGKAPKLDQN